MKKIKNIPYLTLTILSLIVYTLYRGSELEQFIALALLPPVFMHYTLWKVYGKEK